MAYRCRNDGRHPDQVYLKIEPTVLLQDGVRVAFGVANSPHIPKHLLLDKHTELDLEIIYGKWAWAPATQIRLQAAEKVEILVPKSVSVHLIKGKFKAE